MILMSLDIFAVYIMYYLHMSMLFLYLHVLIFLMKAR
jgi:hypothetical protein